MESITSTKERIIYESLTLFSQRGYEGVSMRDIAASVGIKGASIYNHFHSKEKLFDAIISEMTNRYEKAAREMKMPDQDLNSSVAFYSNIHVEQLYELASNLFLFFIKDDFADKFRKILIMEQYRNKQANETLRKYFYEMPIQFQTQLFEGLIKNKVLVDNKASIMSLQFYAPIYFLLQSYDERMELSEVLFVLKDHVYQFIKMYQYKNE